MAVQALDRGPLELRQLLLDLEAELGLQIGEVTVAFGKGAEQVGIQLELRRRIERVHSVFFVNGLPAHDRPLSVSLFEKIIKAAGANHVDRFLVHVAALADRHLGLRNRPAAFHVDARAAEEVKDADALLEAGLAHLDELGRRALEPGGRHPAIVMPHRAKALPVACVAPQRPVMNDFDNCEFVFQGTLSVKNQSAFAPETLTTLAHFTISSRRNLSNWSIDMPMATVPCLSQVSLVSGELITLFTSALSFSSTGRGVLAGAISPSQMPAS